MKRSSLSILALLVVAGCDSGSEPCDPLLGADSVFPFQEGTQWVFNERDQLLGSFENTRTRTGTLRWTFGEWQCNATDFQQAEILQVATGQEQGSERGVAFDRPYEDRDVLAFGVRAIPATPGRFRLQITGFLDEPVEFDLSDPRLEWSNNGEFWREEIWATAGVGIDSMTIRSQPWTLDAGFQTRRMWRVP